MEIITPPPSGEFVLRVSRMELLAISDGLGRLGQGKTDEERYGEQFFTFPLWKKSLQALGMWEHTR